MKPFSCRKLLRAVFCGAALAITPAAYAQGETVTIFGKEIFKSPQPGQVGEDQKWQELTLRHQRSLPNAAFSALVNETRGASYADKAHRVNIAVNNKIAGFNDDVVWGKADYWASPAETLRMGRGDCDDYSILKYHVLRAQGVSADRLFMSSVAINGHAIDHMVLVMNVAEKGERFVILDNRVDELIETKNSSYGFSRAINENGFWEITFQQTLAGTSISFNDGGDLYALDIRAKNETRLRRTYDALRRDGKRGLELASALIDFEMENIVNFDLSKNGRLSSLDVPADSEALKSRMRQQKRIMDF